MELSEKCVGGLVAKGKRGKKRQKVDNIMLIFLSYLIMQHKCSTNFF